MQKYLDVTWWQETGLTILDGLIGWLTSPQFYAQIGAIVGCVIAAWFIARVLNEKSHGLPSLQKKMRLGSASANMCLPYLICFSQLFVMSCWDLQSTLFKQRLAHLGW